MATTGTANADTADLLNRIAALLEAQHANPHRVRAYRSAASTIEELTEPLEDIVQRGDGEALQAIPGIGQRLSKLIVEYLSSGRCPMLQRIEGELGPEDLFALVPGVGEKLAERITRTLHIQTLPELEIAAHDGSLRKVEGLGVRRIEGIKASLAGMLSQSARRRRWRPDESTPHDHEPPVSVLLDVDREYRERAEAGQLRRIAPKRFNPERAAWLPILHTERDEWHVTALFSNTARAHELGKSHDWVVIYFDRDGEEDQVTVVTETRGALKGRRVVRGHELACRRHYGLQE